MTSGSHPDHGNRPPGNRFLSLSILLSILLLAAIAVAFAIVFSGFDVKQIHLIHKSETVQISRSVLA
ncbi:MAG: hypothetical protein ABI158_01835 [Edaphobacter sp.]